MLEVSIYTSYCPKELGLLNLATGLNFLTYEVWSLYSAFICGYANHLASKANMSSWIHVWLYGYLSEADTSYFLENDWNLICIFQGYLSEDALTKVKALLPDRAEGDLAAVCSWADEIKHNYRWRWSSPLHYVDTPDFRCNYKYRSKFGCLLSNVH